MDSLEQLEQQTLAAWQHRTKIHRDLCRFIGEQHDPRELWRRSEQGYRMVLQAWLDAAPRQGLLTGVA